MVRNDLYGGNWVRLHVDIWLYVISCCCTLTVCVFKEYRKSNKERITKTNKHFFRGLFFFIWGNKWSEESLSPSAWKILILRICFFPPFCKIVFFPLSSLRNSVCCGVKGWWSAACDRWPRCIYRGQAEAWRTAWLVQQWHLLVGAMLVELWGVCERSLLASLTTVRGDYDHIMQMSVPSVHSSPHVSLHPLFVPWQLFESSRLQRVWLCGCVLTRLKVIGSVALTNTQEYVILSLAAVCRLSMKWAFRHKLKQPANKSLDVEGWDFFWRFYLFFFLIHTRCYIWDQAFQ